MKNFNIYALCLSMAFITSSVHAQYIEGVDNVANVSGSEISTMSITSSLGEGDDLVKEIDLSNDVNEVGSDSFSNDDVEDDMYYDNKNKHRRAGYKIGHTRGYSDDDY